MGYDVNDELIDCDNGYDVYDELTVTLDMIL